MTDAANRTHEIRAAVVRQRGGPYRIEALELEGPRPDEVLVRIVATGMCHTDMLARDQLYTVPLPVVLGHEGAGIVEQVGARVTKVQPGDHVVLTYMYCGRCQPCLRGKPAYCRKLWPLNFLGAREDGTSAARGASGPVHTHYFGQSSFATFALAHQHGVVKVPETAPLELLGPLGCGIQTGAGAVINALAVGAGASFAAFGVGAVGSSAVMAARLAGAATIIAVDVVPARLELALELGATHVVDGRSGDPVRAVRRITAGGADFTIEASGRPEVLRQAVDALANCGVCGVVGAPALGTEARFDVNGVMAAGKTLRGIVEGESVADLFIPALVDLHAQGRFPFDRLVKLYALEEINQAAADSEAGVTLKPILRIGS